MTNFWVIEQDKQTLLRIMSSLIAMTGAALPLPLAGLASAKPTGEVAGGSVPTSLPRRLYRTILKILRPAEYAARRLIIAFSSSIKLPPPAPRPPKPQPVIRDGLGNPIMLPAGIRISGHLIRTKSIRPSAGRPRKLTLPLFDPLPKFGRPFTMNGSASVPCIWSPGIADRARIPPRPTATDPIATTRIGMRIDAIMAALDDIPGHALRYARWRERTKLPQPAGSKRARIYPLTTGRLPGGNAKATREVHELLKHIQQFAYYAINYPDDS